MTGREARRYTKERVPFSFPVFPATEGIIFLARFSRPPVDSLFSRQVVGMDVQDGKEEKAKAKEGDCSSRQHGERTNQEQAEKIFRKTPPFRGLFFKMTHGDVADGKYGTDDGYFKP